MIIAIILVVVLSLLFCILLITYIRNKKNSEKYIPFDISKPHKYTNWDFVDKILYINLDERPDRDIEINKILSIIPEKYKIMRIPGVKYIPGHIGCSMSHIKALKIAIDNNWKNVLILEDDATWNDLDNGYERLEKLVKKYPNYDVIMLGVADGNFDKNSNKLYKGLNAQSYLVNNHYFRKLLHNFEEGLSKLMNAFKKNSRWSNWSMYNLDVYWWNAMERDNWYVVNPALMIQSVNYSSSTNGLSESTHRYNL